MTKKEIVSLLILVLVISFGAYKYFTRSYWDTRTDQNLLDTAVTIQASSKSKNVRAQIDSVFAYMKTLERKFNDYDPNSWISRVNAAGGMSMPMDPDAFAVLTLADSLYRMTGGAFDITIKPLYDLWGFSDSTSVLNDSLRLPPDSLVIKETLKTVGFDRVRWDRDSIRLPRGTQISFGAIAKGYVLKKAVEYMQAHGFRQGQIDCTSSMVFFGQKIAQVVHIQHPRPQTQNTIGNFKLKNGSLSTSGDYQQFFESGGIRYHHIIDPHTGYPVPDVYSVTVITPDPAWADGLSTAVFLMPPDLAIQKLRQLPDTNAVIYYQSGGETVSLKTEGIKELDWNEE